MILELKATPEEVMRAVEALQEFALAKNLPCKTVFGLALALEESASNIVNHALQRDGQRGFQVALQHGDEVFVIELRDGGPAFDPTSVADRALRAVDEDCPGGWGILPQARGVYLKGRVAASRRHKVWSEHGVVGPIVEDTVLEFHDIGGVGG